MRSAYVAYTIMLFCALPASANARQDSSSAHSAGTAGGTGSPIVQPQEPAPNDTALDRRTRALAAQLRCPVCAGASIQESPSVEAQEMKAVVREHLAAGETEEQVRDFFVSKYGEWILLKPPAHGTNLLVYLLPVALLLGGGFFVYRTARRWTRA